jgi:hypothetical protein
MAKNSRLVIRSARAAPVAGERDRPGIILP